MAHLSAPKPPAPQLPVFYNVDGVVGAPPAQNNTEDVLLVQFAFKVYADEPAPTSAASAVAAARAVRVTGNIDPETIIAIRAYQQSVKDRFNQPNKVVDGRVSPAREGYTYGSVLWTIAQLNNALQNRHLDIWPRIDHIPGCPEGLKTMVKRQVIGIAPAHYL